MTLQINPLGLQAESKYSLLLFVSASNTERQQDSLLLRTYHVNSNGTECRSWLSGAANMTEAETGRHDAPPNGGEVVLAPNHTWIWSRLYKQLPICREYGGQRHTSNDTGGTQSANSRLQGRRPRFFPRNKLQEKEKKWKEKSIDSKRIKEI